MEYELVRNKDGEIEECDCCGYAAPLALFRKPMHLVSDYEKRRTVSQPTLREDQNAYCEVCAASYISVAAHGYPEQYAKDVTTLKCMAYCTNMILEAIKGVASAK